MKRGKEDLRQMANGNSNPSSPAGYNRFLHIFAIVLTVWTFVGVSMGGTVKSHEGGLSIPEPFLISGVKDWDVGNRRYEFTHLLIVGTMGAAAGVFMIAVLKLEKRTAVKRFAVLLFVLVCIQGFWVT